jgi:hypothetical protein
VNSFAGISKLFVWTLNEEGTHSLSPSRKHILDLKENILDLSFQHLKSILKRAKDH